MKLINFSHPLSQESLNKLSEMCLLDIEEICIPVQIDPSAPISSQIDALVNAAIDACGGVAPAAIVPPALGYVAALIALRLASPEGQPGIVCVNRVPGSIPPRFEVTEVL